MSSLEENRNELIELENTIALLKEEITTYRSNTKDGVKRRITLAKMQIKLGKHTRRLRDLRKLV